MNKIGFSTGAIHTWDSSINRQIEILRSIRMDAIEINFAKISDLDEELTDENIAYVRSLDYVSIHAPFFDENRKELYYDNNSAIKKALFKLEKLSQKLNAHAVVFHPDLIKNYSILENLIICIENMPVKRDIDIDSFSDIIKKHPNKIVLDTAHALSFNDDTISEMILRFKDKISHVHFSDRGFSEYKQKISSHQQLLFCDDLDKFKAIKELSCPIIIEVSIQDKVHDIDNLRKEYEVVNRFFNGN